MARASTRRPPAARATTASFARSLMHESVRRRPYITGAALVVAIVGLVASPVAPVVAAGVLAFDTIVMTFFVMMDSHTISMQEDEINRLNNIIRLRRRR